jgi:Amt family ammonium transporter
MGLAIFKLVNWIYPLRVSEEEEEMGLDLSQHDERYQPVGSAAILHEMEMM